ncbi:MAG: DUF5127 domain-containing protein [Prevotella sp.]|jgi:hypothetical protein|nr:DUF5127 domain-containing protein [Prevotella sp.]
MTNFRTTILRKLCFLTAIAFLLGCKEQAPNYIPNSLRAPAYPLITIDSYTNCWLFGDTLYNSPICHSTGREFPLLGVIRVDGESFRFMGAEEQAVVKLIAPTAEQASWEAKYTLTDPGKKWTEPDYNDNNWLCGESAFGSYNYKRDFAPPVHSYWRNGHIWVRREIVLDEDLTGKDVYLMCSHDDDVEIFVNNIQVVNTGKAWYHEQVKLPDEAVATLRKGKNIVAAHAWNRGGNAVLDFGLTYSEPLASSLKQTAVQKSSDVQPTQTIYTLSCGPVDLKLTFTAPALMDNLELLSRPVNYISYEITPNDAQSHRVELYFEAGSVWALSSDFQERTSEAFETDNLVFLKTGSVAQEILGEDKSHFIDWGYFYMASDKNGTHTAIGDCRDMRTAFCSEGVAKNSGQQPSNRQNRLALSRSLGDVSDAASGYIMLGYDDIYSIQYFGDNLRPYWNRKGDKNIAEIFELANKEYEQTRKLCGKFDVEMMNYAFKCGGKEYAELCALAYRQTLCANKLLAAPGGELLYLSNSVIKTATVDVTYPSAPLFLLYNVELLKGMLNPVFDYVENRTWDYPFAPHDIGDYPLANGETSDYFRLPVEESGNVLILLVAIAAIEGNAGYAEGHWDVLTKWADFLIHEGFDPNSQLNTDVFSGYAERDANLSIKAILGIASYARLADVLGKNEIAKEYSAKALSLALKWVTLANAGDHYSFAFGQPDTWSQKYNLVWDKILKIDAFPHEVREKEVAYYLSKQNEYGLPLDSRHLYTKADWLVWSAMLSPNIETFQTFIAPLYKFVNETPQRLPLPDWYWTNDANNYAGFKARPVVGGFFIKMLEDKLINQ